MASNRDKIPSSQKRTDTAGSSDTDALIEKINHWTIGGAERHDGALVSNDTLKDDEDIFFELMAPRVQTSRVTGPKEGRTSTSKVKKGKDVKKPVLAAANSLQKRDTNDNRGQSGLKRGPPESLEHEHTKISKIGERKNRNENVQEGGAQG